MIIAARNAQQLIGTAISSALAQDEVGEVIVVDDASADDTERAAHERDDGTNRLKVISLPINKGPAAARNIALSRSSLPLVSILDADDFFLPGRFRELLATPDWDLIADNIAFVAPDDVENGFRHAPPPSSSDPTWLDLVTFVSRNIPERRSAPRGELGFLKPLIRRSFLDAHDLRYDEGMRLGEDFNLYVRMLANGARFAVSHQVGYVATERPDSLSAMHSADDLAAFSAADEEILRTYSLAPDQISTLRRHRNHIARKCAHRAFLAYKQKHGLLPALAHSAQAPLELWTALCGVAADKLQRLGPARVSTHPPGQPRYLLPPAPRAHNLLTSE